MVPEAAILVVGDDDRGARPQRARLDPGDQAGDVDVAREHIGVTRMLVVGPLRLVEGNLRQIALVDCGDEVGIVLEMLFALRAARRKAREIVEWLVVRDEIRRPVLVVVDNPPLRGGLLHAVLEREVPRAAVPGPGNALR